MSRGVKHLRSFLALERPIHWWLLGLLTGAAGGMAFMGWALAGVGA